MRAFRKPFILSHLYSYYAILIVVGLHILGLVITEIREGDSIVSADNLGKEDHGTATGR